METKDIIKNTVRKNIRYYREENHITQKQLAEILKVKHNTVSNWENGKTSIDTEMLFNICDILGITIVDIYGELCDVEGYPITKTDKSSVTYKGEELSKGDLYLLKLFRLIPEQKQSEFLSMVESALKMQGLL